MRTTCTRTQNTNKKKSKQILSHIKTSLKTCSKFNHLLVELLYNKKKLKKQVVYGQIKLFLLVSNSAFTLKSSTQTANAVLFVNENEIDTRFKTKKTLTKHFRIFTATFPKFSIYVFFLLFL